MKTLSQQINNNLVKNILLLIITVFVLSTTATAQYRTYSKVFSDNLKGGTAMFGNTLTHIVSSNTIDTAKMNNNRANGNSVFGNDNANMQFVDIDGTTGVGAATKNSSSADLTLPTGNNTIKLARLYWGARVRKSEFNIDADSLRRIKIRFGTTGNYTEYAAAQLDKNVVGTGNSTVNQYQAYADITPFVQAKGAGTYTVGNVTASVGSVGNGGNYAGWCIVIVYENLASSDYNSIRLYDGFQQVFNGGNAQISSVTLTGLNVPSGSISLRDAKMGAMVWEGDANLKMDYLKINGTKFYNSLNAIDNPWNGTITDTGKHVTTKNPNYTNQMGIDIDQFFVGNGYGIKGGDTTVALEFGTESDQYFPGLFTFQIKTNTPTVIIDKFVKDANFNNIAEANEVLTYTLKGKNIGSGNANNCIVIDSLPENVTYVPGTMKVINYKGRSAGDFFTDNCGDDEGDYFTSSRAIVCRVGNGANGTTGGILAPDESFEIEFQVTVNKPTQSLSVTPIINVARITGYSDAGIKSTDDGTAILEPLGGPLPVTLKNFLASLISNNLVKLNWATTMEINCKKYEVERSVDGKIFTLVSTLAGNGNSSTEKNYTANDDVTSITSSIVYYRLKQTDADGKSSISKVISVRLQKVTSSFTVSPNPFSSFVNISIDWSKTESTTLKVFSMSGKEMVAKNVQMNKGTNYVAISELNTLPAGSYIIKFNTAEGSIYKQVIKQ
jgi:uncharacterized repeat protein (TIGR01451 family)